MASFLDSFDFTFLLFNIISINYYNLVATQKASTTCFTMSSIKHLMGKLFKVKPFIITKVTHYDAVVVPAGHKSYFIVASVVAPCPNHYRF